MTRISAPVAIPDGRWLLLSGGVGGAKLALGLDRELPPGALTVIVNTGDDFTHLGLSISPDLDTLMYTLGGVVNEDTGWGLAGETWEFMEALERLGGETWFRLGDRDLATHVERTRQLAAGESLTQVTAALCARFRIASRILPMSDRRLETRVVTAAGELAFQDYFVRQQAAPVVSGFRYGGANDALSDEVRAACADPELRGIFIAPSNPWLSIAPLLAFPALLAELRNADARGVPIIAVSPLVAGAALKGPTAKIMSELGLQLTQAAIAGFYRDVVAGLVIDHADAQEAALIEREGIAARCAATVMRTLEDKRALARHVLAFAAELAEPAKRERRS